MNSTCRNCLYARERDVDPMNLTAQRALECRKNPPGSAPMMATHAGQQMLGTFTLGWPQVKADDWCGAFEPARSSLVS